MLQKVYMVDMVYIVPMVDDNVSITDFIAESLALKSFVMGELYSINVSFDRIQTEHSDQSKYLESVYMRPEMKRTWYKISTHNKEITFTLLFITSGMKWNFVLWGGPRSLVHSVKANHFCLHMCRCFPSYDSILTKRQQNPSIVYPVRIILKIQNLLW